MFAKAIRFFLVVFFGCLLSTASSAAEIWRNIAPVPTINDPTNLYNLSGYDGYRLYGSDRYAPPTVNDNIYVGSFRNGGFSANVYFDVSRLPTKVERVVLWYYLLGSSTLPRLGFTIDDSSGSPYDVIVPNPPAEGMWVQIDITGTYRNWKTEGGLDNNGLFFTMYSSPTYEDVFVSAHTSNPDMYQYVPRLQVITQGPEPFFANFPLTTDLYPQGPYTPRMMTSALDHQMAAGHSLYDYDGYVGAYTGEWGAADTGYPQAAQACYPVINPVSSAQNVDVEGLYVGMGGNCTRGGTNSDGTPYGGLNYDGHTGYDYIAAEGREVHAAAGGVQKKCIMTSTKSGETCDSWGMISIEHTINGEKYRTQYEHLSSYELGIDPDVTPLTAINISAGQLIGHSGLKSPPTKPVPPHFHFEVLKWDPNGLPDQCPQDQEHCVDGGIVDPDGGSVQPNGSLKGSWKIVDPYGWNGKGVDLLESATGIPNWRLWK